MVKRKLSKQSSVKQSSAKRTTAKRTAAKTAPRSKQAAPGKARPRSAAPIPVVAIGASAGGLEPIGAFLGAMPADSGLAFVIIQHLDPVNKSMLPELLARHTAMRVRPAENGIILAPNEVYVIPPGFYLTIASGRLHFRAMQIGRGARMPIDLFLNALATDRGNRGIGIIMSGTGTDGAQGLKALKEAGGLALVQDPDEAQQDGMPRYAMHMARPDHILPVADMPPVLLRYVAHDYVNHPHAAVSAEEPMAPGEPTLAEFVSVLRAKTGEDFEFYKAATLERRIERRMALNAMQGRANYLKVLNANPTEAEALVKDLLINVTGFFRDRGAFNDLAKHLAKTLPTHRSDDQPIRVWVAGCSTGEEAYSLGIVLMELIAAAQQHVAVQIFATDIDDEALQVARAGVYPESAVAELAPERIERFFVREDQHFRVVKPLRDAVIFSHHDVLRDPPFSKMDLVSCRNLLIYLKSDAQRRVLTLLHFALGDDGILFLGAAESVSPASGLFDAISEKSRIYRRIATTRLAKPRVSVLEAERALDVPESLAQPAHQRAPSLSDIVQRVMLEAYTPAAVVTNKELAPLYYFGATDRYLRIVAGEPDQDLLAMAREGLRGKLREIVARALRSKRRVTSHGVWFEREGRRAVVTIEAQRLPNEHSDHVLVSFVDELPQPEAATAKPSKSTRSALESQLRQELAETRQELNRTIHDLRRTNEELKAKNQEAMSQNEEFLSTNEELQSSKEELQSLNEELSTVNSQLRQTLEQQQQTSTDLSNVLNSSAVATIFLDAQLRIKAFNPRMKALFALIDTDIGRPLADLLPKFADPDLLADATAARSEGKSNEREIRAESGSWYLRSALPYLTETGEIRGAVVTFADVSRLKHAEIDAAAARAYAETVVDTIAEPLAVLDSELKIASGNTAFATAFDLNLEQVRARPLRELKHPVLSDARLRALLTARLQQEGSAHIEIEVEQPRTGYHVWRASARRFRAPSMVQPMLLLGFNDIADQRRIVYRQLQLMLDALPGAFLVTDKDRRIRFVSASMEVLFGYHADELIGQRIDMLVPPEIRARHAELHAAFNAHPSPRPMGAGFDINGITKDGQRIPLDIGLSPVPTADGVLVVAAIHDLRLQKQNEMQLRDAKAAAERANQAKSRFLAAASHDLRQPLQIIALLHNLLSQKVSEPEARTILTRLEGTVDNMTELLDTLLDVNQIESGAVVPLLGDLPLSLLLTRAREEFVPLAAAKGLKLHVVQSSAVIHSDRHLLVRMLDNLLSNAIKYTTRGKILLGCRRRGNWLRIEVWDTGIGIPAESIDAVFDEFYRLDRDDTSRFGLGLGLYIVKHFAELLGHVVEVRSRPGKGTMFAVLVPLAGFAPNDKPHDGGAVDPADPLILLVENDRLQAETLTALLEAEGYRVMSATTAVAALDLLDDGASIRPDLVIADHNLPGGMSGLQLIARIRVKLGPDIAALIVSGDKSLSTLKMFEASGLMYVSKPYKAPDLLTAVDVLTKSARHGALLTSKRTSPAPPAQPGGAGLDVAIIDDEPGVREALRLSLEATGLGVTDYDSAEAFLADHERGQFRCLVIDIALPGMDGLALQARLKEERFAAPIILMTGGSDLPMAVKAMRAGATDFLQKPVNGAVLGESVRHALKAGDQSASHRAEDEMVVTRLATLTARERQVMERMVAGETTKNIAADLSISQRTTEHHRQSVMHKMAARSLATLVRMVMAHIGPTETTPVETSKNGK